MRRVLAIAGIIVFAGLGAVAQDETQQKLMMNKLKAEIASVEELAAREAVMAQPVLGAPYSATEVNESTQTLADGTTIHHENKAQVYRDGAGRTRREAGNTIVIMDPVAKMRYNINLEHKTAMAMPMGFVKTAGGRGGVGIGIGAGDQIVTYRSDTGAAISGVFVNKGEAVRKEMARANSEDLGPQTIEGVVANGTRTTRTIDTGEIGNDRPINITSERWYSQQLQTMMMTRQNDPRSGENTFKLTNVKLGEPDPGLFQVPAGYQVSEPRTEPRKE
ncbi:MAG TPA: hypothetical protein VKB88_10850 [Bryobacteraceae bacterium]|nr:hypothetical protein [Bryobacteraceae bacterium]